jgi:hypothetical protein
MNIAYIISAYRNPEQLVRLILRLDAAATTILVHVDKKTDDRVFDQIVRHTKHLPNVVFLKRYTCYWGGFGHVQATLEGLREIFKRNIPFDYVILLTGQDYPIKSNEQIRVFLQQNDGQSFIEHFPLPSDHWEGGGLQRVEKWHWRLGNRRLVFPKNGRFPIRRKFPNQLQPFGGSSYWCLTRECVRYIYDFINHNNRFVKFFRLADVPDEIFFQTIVMNSPYAGTVVNDNLRYIEWNDPSSGSPAILRRDDFPKIAHAPQFFARKFDMFVDNEVLDLIDQELGVI